MKHAYFCAGAQQKLTLCPMYCLSQRNGNFLDRHLLL